MSESIAVCVSSYNTLSTRREGLDACLEGLRRSIIYFSNIHPDVKVVVSWVDDASTDMTAEHVQIELSLDDKVDFKILKLEENSHQGYCRNLAAKLVDSDYIMFCDSDDVFLEDHIKVCYEIIQSKDTAGRLYSLGTTQAYINPDLRVHPDWIPRISGTIPITKIIRRDIWEFLEGFPDYGIYRYTGCEDEDFMKLATYFFGCVGVPGHTTVEYKCYPGSFFDRQLPKFRKHPNFMEPDEDDKLKADLHNIRLNHINSKLEYLRSKLTFTEWYNKLEKYMTLYT